MFAIRFEEFVELVKVVHQVTQRKPQRRRSEALSHSKLFHTHSQTEAQTQFAQVAELVDALVSNTNVFTDVPVRLRPWVLETALARGARSECWRCFFYTRAHSRALISLRIENYEFYPPNNP